jgi:hypothetical protein
LARQAIAYNWGWRLSRAASLDRVDQERLAKELAVRGITCELPGCDNTAFSVLPSGITALVCFNHTTAYQTSARVATAIESAIKFLWQGHMAIVTNAAFEDANDHTVITFTDDQGLLNKARLATHGVEELIQQEARKFSGFAAQEVRPTLDSLPLKNTTEVLFDPFVL